LLTFRALCTATVYGLEGRSSIPFKDSIFLSSTAFSTDPGRIQRSSLLGSDAGVISPEPKGPEREAEPLSSMPGLVELYLHSAIYLHHIVLISLYILFYILVVTLFDRYCGLEVRVPVSCEVRTEFIYVM
jgi:hypothetical protein